MQKAFNGFLDALLFVVPLLDLFIIPVLSSGEASSFIPPQYIGYYMLAIVVLRRVARLLEDRHAKGKTDGGSDVA
jgi:hypothetical protein